MSDTPGHTGYNVKKADKIISLFCDMDTTEQSKIIKRLTRIMLDRSGGVMDIQL